ncbi:MAG TPA: type II secretion system protein [Patescibacteria group bacterium]|nr:type II secretion system protein [Patescibacteria group bacterium]
MKAFQRGFTLIELLVVIAVLGILSTVVMALINPGEQMAKARDAGRKQIIAEVGRALQNYATQNGGVFPSANANWQSALIIDKDIINYSTASATTTLCTQNQKGNICYNSGYTTNGQNDAVVWTPLESAQSAGLYGCTSTQTAIYVWEASLGGTGGYCVTTTSLSTYTITSPVPTLITR